MKKFNKKVPLLFASFALMMGIGLVGGAKAVKADSTTIKVSMGTYADEHGIPKSSGTLNEESIAPELYLDENITVTAEMVEGHGVNEASFWASGNEWRLYNGGQDTSSKLVISAKNGATLVSYSIKYTSSNSGTLATSRGQNKSGAEVISSNAVVTASGSTAECYVANTEAKTNGQVKVTEISVTYNASSSVEPEPEKTVTSVTSVASHPTEVVVDGVIEGKDVTLNVVYSDSTTGTEKAHHVDVNTATAATGVTATAYYDAEETMYATFSVDVIKAPTTTTITVVMGTYADEHGIPKSSGTLNEESIAPELYLDENITVTVEMAESHADNEASFWASGNEWRLYNGGQDTSSKLVISAKNNATLVSYSIAYNSNNNGTLATSRGQNKSGAEVISSNAVVAASGATAECYVANTDAKTNGQVKVTKITVVYAMPEETPDIPVNPVEITILDIWNFHGGSFAAVKFESGFDAVEYFKNGSIYVGENKVSSCRADGDAFIMDGFDDEGKATKLYTIKFYNAEGTLVAQGSYLREVILPTEPVKLNAPEGLVINTTGDGRKILAFADVTNASGYHVQYRQGEEVKYEHDIANGGLLNPDADYAAGTYDIYVKTLGDGEHYLDSDYALVGPFEIIVEVDPQAEAEAFVQEWLSLRNAEGSICDQVKGEATELKEMIAKYDALSPEVKAIVDASLDYEGNTIQNSVEYLRSFLGLNEAPSADQSAGGLLLTAVKDNAGTIAIVLALIVGTFVGYIVLRRKNRLVK